MLAKMKALHEVFPRTNTQTAGHVKFEHMYSFMKPGNTNYTNFQTSKQLFSELKSLPKNSNHIETILTDKSSEVKDMLHLFGSRGTCQNANVGSIFLGHFIFTSLTFLFALKCNVNTPYYAPDSKLLNAHGNDENIVD